MTITKISGIGSEIVAAVSRNSKLDAAAWNMRKAIRYYHEIKESIPQVAERAKNDALNLCNEYSKLAYDNPLAKESDMKLCFSFWKNHATD